MNELIHPHPGATDSIVDVAGLVVGQVELGASQETPDGATGVTAVVAPDGAIGAVDVRGAAPGTRETDALSALASGERAHAVLFVGRSAYGLAAADGATRELERRGIGLPIDAPNGRIVIPIVAAAVVFDFAHGDPAVRPDQEDGRRAIVAALDGPGGRPRSGNAGAGAGAATGSIVQPRLKGGVGHASLVVPGDGAIAVGRAARAGLADLVVGALVVVNSAGSLVDPVSDRPWATWGGFNAPGPVPDFERISSARGQTTLAVVGTNARLGKTQLARVAAMAHDGLARAIRPVHSSVDGDVVFALAVPEGLDRPAVEAHPWGPAATTIVGALAADAVTRAVLDALESARPSDGLEAYRR